ncbi:hypothetical protein Slin14017_G097710 [Septoria linicola]|nr:hypothetical protein Slin14017_G097710 [Septoria linicola]
MKTMIVIISGLASLLNALPIPLSNPHTTDLASNNHSPSGNHVKRQGQWSWTSDWATPGWKGPSTNPYDICSSPEGKQLNAECSGGDYSQDDSSYNGYVSEHSEGSFHSYHIGSPSNAGWNPFAGPKIAPGRTNTGGGISTANRGQSFNGNTGARIGTTTGSGGAGGGEITVNGQPAGGTGARSTSSGGDRKGGLGCIDLVSTSNIDQRNCHLGAAWC